MESGDDINWTKLTIGLVVNDGANLTCLDNTEDDSGQCYYDVDDDQNWSVNESITIREGQDSLCEPEQSCGLEMTISMTEPGQDERILQIIEFSLST